jgi:ABC-type thiamine transport system ATPase subunit
MVLRFKLLQQLASNRITERCIISDEPAVVVENFAAAIEPAMRPFVGHLVSQLSARKRVGVLISGSGTNLQVH